MKCSIVMPVLDGEAYIAAAVKSVLSQDYMDWELIIVDGGSKDSTLSIIKEIQENDKRVRLIHQVSTGMYGAIFEGFDEAEGDLFSWLNSDDLYPSWALKVAVEVFQSSKEKAWITGFPGAWDRQGGLRYLLPISIWPQSWIRKGYFHPDFLGCIQAESTFFRRALWESLTVEDRGRICSLNLAGDYLIWRQLAKSQKLVSVPTLMGGFRNHGGNRSITLGGKYMEEVYSTGTLKLSPRIGRRLGQLFSAIAGAYGYRTALRESARLNHENSEAAR